MGDTEVLDADQTQIDPTLDRPVDVEDLPLTDDSERFDRIGLLGKGGMGEVRLYRDRRISRYVAYKVLKSPLHQDPLFRSRFLLEARVQGQLEHPAIVPVHDLGETEDGEPFFSMKCVRGVTLRQALAKTGAAKYSRRRLLTAFSSVCLAVDFAHARGVVHRDLKPQNIMLGQFGEVYVLDWGIAKVMHRPDTPLSEIVDVQDTAQTHAGAMLGTPKYMAPERQLGVANPATDVYALGVILGEILEADPDVPPELAAIHERATAVTAEGRYQSARELHEALERYLDGDRDLEARRKLAEEHVERAEAAFTRGGGDPVGRAEAGRAIGRALGLDPSNTRALRMLMRMLSEMPAQLPDDARAALEQHRRERTRRTLHRTNLVTITLLGMLPMFLWMRVRDTWLLASWVALALATIAMQYVGGRTGAGWARTSAFMLLMATFAVQATSMGLLGVLPAAMAIAAMAWRMQVTKTLHGTLIAIVCTAAVLAPFLLVGSYDVHDGMIVLVPRMHEFPRIETLASIAFSTCAAMIIAVLYGRLFMNELRRAEERLHFQAWQLQQLVSADSSR